MQFDGHAANFDILSDVDFWAGTTSTSYSTEDKTRNINLAYDRAISLILQTDGNWEWDDTNHTDLPIATATLTSGQQDYAISTVFLKVLRVAIKDTSGNYYYLNSIDDHDLTGQELMDRDAGRPTSYKKLGNSIILDRAPDYTASTGIKIYFQRNVDYFTTADTTQAPGFAAPYHRLLSLGAAKDYCAVNDMPKRLGTIEKEIARLEKDLIAFYFQRSKDERPRLRLRQENYGADEGIGMSSKTIY